MLTTLVLPPRPSPSPPTSLQPLPPSVPSTPPTSPYPPYLSPFTHVFPLFFYPMFLYIGLGIYYSNLFCISYFIPLPSTFLYRIPYIIPSPQSLFSPLCSFPLHSSFPPSLHCIYLTFPSLSPFISYPFNSLPFPANKNLTHMFLIFCYSFLLHILQHSSPYHTILSVYLSSSSLLPIVPFPPPHNADPTYSLLLFHSLPLSLCSPTFLPFL